MNVKPKTNLGRSEVNSNCRNIAICIQRVQEPPEVLLFPGITKTTLQPTLCMIALLWLHALLQETLNS